MLHVFGALTIFVIATISKVYGGEAPEPFPDLFGFCSTCGPPQPASPDPLVRYTWKAGTNMSQLQVFKINRPNNFLVDPPDSISGIESLLKNSTEPLNLQIRTSGALRLDWGTEHAAWIEFESPDLGQVLDTTNITVRASISEFNSPYPGKTRQVTKYGKCTFRLETNQELYEGVRYTWLYFDIPATAKVSWHITQISLIAKVKPVNYTGSFQSSDDALTQAWYTGAYGVRLNMEADGFNSILIERGDRVAIQGDGHPTMAAALVAFSPFGLVKNMLDQTNSGHVHGHHVVDDSIMAYPLYWTLSVNDWFMASGDVSGFQSLAPDAMSIIDERVNDFLQPDLNIVWMGWDDRLSNGWCFLNHDDPCNRESHLTFAGLVVRACRDLSRSLQLAGMAEEAQKYQSTAARLAKTLGAVPEWPQGFGVHASANAINTGFIDEKDTKEFFDNALTDPTNICSHSPFNQYWILQALGNANKLDYAIASIKLCWGAMLTLGRGCFWELFSPDWASFLSPGDKAPTMPSYCHPWSSGVTAWLSQILAGVQPLLPGYTEYVVSPFVSATNPLVSAVVSTPSGRIAVTATLKDQITKNARTKWFLAINIQAPVQGFVGIPKHIEDRTGCILGSYRAIIDGRTASVATVEDVVANNQDAGSLALGDHFNPIRSSSLLFARIPTAGNHTVLAVYYGDECNTMVNSTTTTPESTKVGIPHIPPYPIPKYPAKTDLDRISQGDGLSIFGSDGFVLFGYNNGTDLSKLPSYIRNVSVQTHGFFNGWAPLPRRFVGTSEDDPAYLPDPTSSDRPRSLGLVSKNDNSDDFDNQDIILNIELEREKIQLLGGRMATENIVMNVETASDVSNLSRKTFRVSIYCVAQDVSEKHAVRAMDLKTLNVIAPTSVVSNYTDGVWWNLEYHRSIRLRFMSIYGLRISAIGFSKGRKTGEERLDSPL